MGKCKKMKKKDSGSGNLTQEDRLQKYEDELKLLAEKIKKVGEKEIDLDEEDDKNSPFEELGKLQKRFWYYWSKLCKHAGCNPLRIGRSVERRFKIRDGILKDGHPELVKKLEEYVNKKPVSYMPKFPEIRNVLMHERHVIPGEGDVDVDDVANRFLTAFCNDARERRMRDLFDSISDPNDTSNDAADEDPLFEETFRENKELNDEALAKIPAIVNRIIQDEQGGSEEDSEAESVARGSRENVETPKAPPNDILRDDDSSDDDFKVAPPSKKFCR